MAKHWRNLSDLGDLGTGPSCSNGTARNEVEFAAFLPIHAYRTVIIFFYNQDLCDDSTFFFYSCCPPSRAELPITTLKSTQP